jgi:hypothetical protein
MMPVPVVPTTQAVVATAGSGSALRRQCNPNALNPVPKAVPDRALLLRSISRAAYTNSIVRTPAIGQGAMACGIGRLSVRHKFDAASHEGGIGSGMGGCPLRVARPPAFPAAPNPCPDCLPFTPKLAYAAMRQEYCHLPVQQAKGSLAPVCAPLTAAVLRQGKLWLCKRL